MTGIREDCHPLFVEFDSICPHYLTGVLNSVTPTQQHNWCRCLHFASWRCAHLRTLTIMYARKCQQFYSIRTNVMKLGPCILQNISHLVQNCQKSNAAPSKRYLYEVVQVGGVCANQQTNYFQHLRTPTICNTPISAWKYCPFPQLDKWLVCAFVHTDCLRKHTHQHWTLTTLIFRGIASGSVFGHEAGGQLFFCIFWEPEKLLIIILSALVKGQSQQKNTHCNFQQRT